MKNIFLKYGAIAFCVLSNFMVFAQPSSENDSGNLETDDAPAAPIDSKLYLLAFLAILFAIYTFRKNRKTA